ncbi:MAG: carbohydrate porin [Chlorogloeopsis fritschii C42_A2020_084]|uniref:iron uptake porin n=1 Tax=Chlorogloeopsis fritschii TaxID=1124 RepID=UPI0019F35BB4|nr:iron uptake porin [Chlorogloeopsis fritschii]MBF2006935.1 carbohydrate porin [Chlorogloeopsis fritschii C42_A2020_084]
MIGIKYFLLTGASAIVFALSISMAKAIEQPKIEEALQSINTSVAQLSEKESVKLEKNLQSDLNIDIDAEQSIDRLTNVSQLKDDENSPEDNIEQVTSVSQLSDVQPSDWAFGALQSLIERYGVIAGYPNGTFRGNRAMTRYEFAAGLNAALDKINQIIAAGTENNVRKEDLVTLQKLQEEFAAELATLRGRVDTLEARTAEIEAQQFSTTTIMNAEVIFAVSSAFGGDPPGGCRVLDDDTGYFFDVVYPQSTGDRDQIDEVDCGDREEPARNTVFSHLTRIGLQSSFTGKDVLRTYLTTGNFDNGGFTNPESLNTYMARLSHQAGLNNKVYLDLLEYRFPAFNDKVVFSVIPFGFELSSVLSANSPYFDIGRGSISRFGQLNPVLRIGGPMDAGVGFDWLIADPVRLQVAYGTRDSGDFGEGIFGADHSALGVQLVVRPTQNIVTGISYVNAYSSDGTLGTYTGSVNAETSGLWSGSSIPAPPNEGNLSGFEPCCRYFLGDQPAHTNAVGASLQWRVTEKLTFGAWGGYMFTNFLEALPNFPIEGAPNGIGNSAGKKPFANAATFLVSLGISDPFGREGDLLGFLFGMPPKLVDAGPETQGTPVPFFEQVVREEDPTPVTDNNDNLNTVSQFTTDGRENLPTLPKRVGVRDKATSLHFEVFYRFRVSDNVWITPGFFVVTNPGHIADNDTIFVGTLRTTFRF